MAGDFSLYFSHDFGACRKQQFVVLTAGQRHLKGAIVEVGFNGGVNRYMINLYPDSNLAGLQDMAQV